MNERDLTPANLPHLSEVEQAYILVRVSADTRTYNGSVIVQLVSFQGLRWQAVAIAYQGEEAENNAISWAREFLHTHYAGLPFEEHRNNSNFVRIG